MGLCGSFAASSLVRANGDSVAGLSAMPGNFGCGRSKFQQERRSVVFVIEQGRIK